MKIPVLTRLSLDSFPDQKEWIGKLLGAFNTLSNFLYLAMNSGLTFADNFLGQETSVDFTYRNSSDFPMYFALSMKVPPKAIQVCRAFEGATPIIMLLAWDITSDNRIRVTEMSKVSSATLSALTSGLRYQVLLRFTP